MKNPQIYYIVSTVVFIFVKTLLLMYTDFILDFFVIADYRKVESMK